MVLQSGSIAQQRNGAEAAVVHHLAQHDQTRRDPARRGGVTPGDRRTRGVIRKLIEQTLHRLIGLEPQTDRLESSVMKRPSSVWNSA